MELHVDIRINPHPDKLPAGKLDELLEGELVEFERWFLQQQRLKGNMNPSSLLNVEKAVVKTFILYAATKTVAPAEGG